MKTSLEGKIQIIALEGLCPRIYYDDARVPIKTLGLGSTVADLPNIANLPLDKYFPVPFLVGLFGKSLRKYEDAVNEVLEVEVSQAKFDALVSICYNIGTGFVKLRKGGLAGSTFMKCINRGDSLAVISKAIMQWVVPKILFTRRSKEATLYTKEIYQNDGYCLLFDTDGKGKRRPYSTAKRINVKEILRKSQEEAITSSIPTSSIEALGSTITPTPTTLAYLEEDRGSMDNIIGLLENAWNVLENKPEGE